MSEEFIWAGAEAVAACVTALFAGGALFYAHQAAKHATHAFRVAGENAASALHHDAKVNKTNQLMDVWQHCASRYDTLKHDLVNMPAGTDAAAYLKNFWSRYWGLKNDQFDFWLYGYLDHDTFCD